jgi:hypothetical protein
VGTDRDQQITLATSIVEDDASFAQMFCAELSASGMAAPMGESGDRIGRVERLVRVLLTIGLLLAAIGTTVILIRHLTVIHETNVSTRPSTQRGPM